MPTEVIRGASQPRTQNAGKVKTHEKVKMHKAVTKRRVGILKVHLTCHIAVGLEGIPQSNYTHALTQTVQNFSSELQPRHQIHHVLHS